MQFCLQDLFDHAGSWPREKATRTTLRRIQLNAQQRRILFLATSAESYSSPQGHVVSLFYPKAGRFERLLQNRRATPLNQTCRVGCSCEAWRYWGAAYKSTDQGYRLPGEQWRETRAPVIRDPEGTYWICKHAIRVAEELAAMTFSQMAQDGGGPKTTQHALASLDALRDPISGYLLRRGKSWTEVECILSCLDPADAEDEMADLGMLCPDHQEPSCPP